MDDDNERPTGSTDDVQPGPIGRASSKGPRGRPAKAAANGQPNGQPNEPDDRTRANRAAQLLLARGDKRGAIEVLMNAHGEMIFAHCVRTLRDRILAEDVLQQVFYEAHRDLEKFRGQAALGTWLYSIAAHRCSDVIKTARRRAGKIDSDEDALTTCADPGSAPGERLDQARLVEALEDCLEELSDEVRATVLLRFQSGMTYEQMASSLDAKPDTLCARVARALPLIKRCLERKGWGS